MSLKFMPMIKQARIILWICIAGGLMSSCTAKSVTSDKSFQCPASKTVWLQCLSRQDHLLNQCHIVNQVDDACWHNQKAIDFGNSQMSRPSQPTQEQTWVRFQVEVLSDGTVRRAIS